VLCSKLYLQLEPWQLLRELLVFVMRVLMEQASWQMLILHSP